jgi:hypothetical protein
MIQVTELTVGKIPIQAVNWFDYDGWEVRISHEAEMGFRGIRLGFITTKSGSRFDDDGYVANDLHHREMMGGFDSMKDAVQYLLDNFAPDALPKEEVADGA